MPRGSPPLLRTAVTVLLALGLADAGHARAPDRPAHYAIEVDEAGTATFRATNPAQGIEARLSPAGLELGPARGSDAAPWRVALTLVGVGRGTWREPPEAPAAALRGTRLELRRGDLVEWYESSRAGIEQGFTLQAPPAPDRPGELLLELQLSGDATVRRERGGLALATPTGRVLRYGAPRAFDAHGTPLPAAIALSGAPGPRVVRLVVDDAGAVYPVTVDPLVSTTQIKLAGSETNVGDAFGDALAVSGDVAVVGAPWANLPGNPDQGEAYLFRFDGDAWVEEARLEASDGAADDRFGAAVAVSGELVVIGAPGRSGGEGGAYVFRADGVGGWWEEGILTASDASPGDGLASSLAVVSVAGAVALVGAPAWGGGQGKVYAYLFDGLGWSELQGIAASDGEAGDAFGAALAASFDRILVGAPDHDGPANAAPDRGEVYEFALQGGAWVEQTTLAALTPAAVGDQLGSSLALAGDLALAGAPGVTGSGAAHLLRRDGAGWLFDAELTASDGATGDRFGAAVSLLGDRIAVGAWGADAERGAAYLYLDTGTDWSEDLVLAAYEGRGGDRFGVALGLTGEGVLLGASLDDTGASANHGSVYRIPLLDADLDHARYRVWWLAPDGAGGTQLSGGAFVGSADVATTVTLPFSGDPPTSFGGLHYDACGGRLFWLASDGAGATALHEAPFDGSELGTELPPLPFSGVPPDEQAGLHWDRLAGTLYVLAEDAPDTAAVFERPFDGATLGTPDPTPVLVWSSTTGPASFGGLSGDPLSGEVAVLAPVPGGPPATLLVRRPWTSGSSTATESLIGPWSSLLPSDYAGLSIARSRCTFEESKRVVPELSAFAFFATFRAGDVSGDVAAVGTPNGESVHVYRWDGASWAEEAEVVASDGAGGDDFGSSVSLSGDALLVGAPTDDDQGGDSGSAYVFRFDGTTWNEEIKLLAADGEALDRFGTAVSLAGPVAIVGAIQDDDNGPSAGAAYVFRFDGAAWNEEAKLLPSDGATNDQAGFSVSVSGDVAVVGARTADDALAGPNAGAAYVYRWNGAAWNEEQEIVASDGVATAEFGFSVANTDDVIVVGAWRDEGAGSDTGSAYVYRWNGGDWTEEAKLVDPQGAELDFLGAAVAVDEDVAVVGAYGHDGGGLAYSYRFDGMGWNEDTTLLASDADPGDRFGALVAVANGVALVGAPGDSDVASEAGSAYLFRLGSCGDGVIDPGEACDDGGRLPGDGCSGSCQVEACANGQDDDGDGLTDFVGADPGCWGAADLSELRALLPCDNGLDDDGDGDVDVAQDPGCWNATWVSEAPQCSNGNDDDNDGRVDWDGAGLGAADPQCVGPHDNRERPNACGLGFEIALLLPGLALARRRRRLHGRAL